ncbi:MAG: ABC transporter ATP-binding protein [Rhodospirillaceae bacterium]|jgi:lipoprotein-releasing system ATP-binding protein|nr:ABC transporter ATP-binding protein [Rhodospirillaceae bacterium]
MSEPILFFKNVTRSFHQGGGILNVLNDISFELHTGEIVALVGNSGSGKSTLLQIAGLLEHPNEGEVYFCKESCGKLSDYRRTIIRRDQLGFVYQHHRLLPEFSAIENIVLPQMIAGVSRQKATDYGLDLLNKMDLLSRADHHPGQLSGGEQQRVAIARALANKPCLLLADEPTGNLDHKTSNIIFKELLNMAKDVGLTAIIATHNSELTHRMDRVLVLHNGRLQDFSN